MKYSIKEENGITMIALVITIMILLLLTSMLIYNSKDSIQIKALTNLYNDLELLREKVSDYYDEYGQIPKLEKYSRPSELLDILNSSEKDDTSSFYVIDLEAMQGITLNYGKDYEVIRARKESNENFKIEDYKEVYIINEDTHNIFYVQGINIKENNITKTYYTDYVEPDETIVDLRYIDGILIPNGYFYIGKEKDNMGNESILISNERDVSTSTKKYVWRKQISNITSIDEISNIILSENQNESEFIKSVNHYKGFFINKDEGTDRDIVYLPVKEDKWSEVYTKNEKYVDKNGDIAYIPKGFRVSLAEGSNEIRNGLLISDNVENNKSIGNEFIWIPVSNFENFIRKDFGITQIDDANFITTNPTEEKYYESVGDGENVDNTANQSIQEVQNMYKSVKEYNGFYIGRYETGIDGNTARTNTSGISQVPVVKKNKYIYNFIKWGNGLADENGGAVEVARSMYTDTAFDGVQSTLCYGVQWDAVMSWINKDSSLRFVFTDGDDSYKIGNYDISGNLIKTGSDEFFQIKNIYDVAGNVCEWTMETFGLEGKVLRGGKSGSRDGVSFRENGDIATISGVVGFRVALYIK